MRLLPVAIAFAVATLAFADTITLKSGRVITGTYLGGTPRTVKVDVGDEIQTFDVADILRIEFDHAAPPPPPPAPPVQSDRPTLRRDSNVMRPDTTPPPAPAPSAGPLGVTLPAGTNIVIRMIDGVDSQTASVGQTFAASLDAPINDANGQTLVPRGADVVVKLVDATQSGKIEGRTELALALQSVRISGQMVDLNTQTVSEKSDSRGARSGKVIGGSAIGGAILGGILGGGKGAVIGATAGAGAGTGVEMATKGQIVRVPAETRLTFVLDSPVRI
ncbi:MAG TPA: hypothetical protein VLY04_22805 [Bryobacteraceae bacterium]|nr:hypothetical protein [Bryobacteraceae bacterium]